MKRHPRLRPPITGTAIPQSLSSHRARETRVKSESLTSISHPITSHRIPYPQPSHSTARHPTRSENTAQHHSTRYTHPIPSSSCSHFSPESLPWLGESLSLSRPATVLLGSLLSLYTARLFYRSACLASRTTPPRPRSLSLSLSSLQYLFSSQPVLSRRLSTACGLVSSGPDYAVSRQLRSPHLSRPRPRPPLVPVARAVARYPCVRSASDSATVRQCDRANPFQYDRP